MYEETFTQNERGSWLWEGSLKCLACDYGPIPTKIWLPPSLGFWEVQCPICDTPFMSEGAAAVVAGKIASHKPKWLPMITEKEETMEKPSEVKLRNLEHTRMKKALDAWEEGGCPERDGHVLLEELRRRVVNANAAQKLVEDTAQPAQSIAELKGVLETFVAERKLKKKGLLLRDEFIVGDEPPLPFPRSCEFRMMPIKITGDRTERTLTLQNVGRRELESHEAISFTAGWLEARDEQHSWEMARTKRVNDNIMEVILFPKGRAK